MKKNKKVPLFIKLLFTFLIVFSLLFFILVLYDTKIFKTVVEISHIQSKSTANTIIDEAVQNTIKELNITSSDFFIEKQQYSTAVSVNTILINTFCSTVSMAITEGMEKIAEEHISIALRHQVYVTVSLQSQATILSPLNLHGFILCETCSQ